jgi:hypothetical protein
MNFNFSLFASNAEIYKKFFLMIGLHSFFPLLLPTFPLFSVRHGFPQIRFGARGFWSSLFRTSRPWTRRPATGSRSACYVPGESRGCQEDLRD